MEGVHDLVDHYRIKVKGPGDRLYTAWDQIFDWENYDYLLDIVAASVVIVREIKHRQLIGVVIPLKQGLLKLRHLLKLFGGKIGKFQMLSEIWVRENYKAEQGVTVENALLHVKLLDYLGRVLLVNLGYVSTCFQCFLKCKVFEAGFVFGIKSLDVAEIEFSGGLRIRQCFVAFPLVSQKLLLNLLPQH